MKKKRLCVVSHYVLSDVSTRILTAQTHTYKT